MSCDSATVLAAAITNGYARLSERDLKECILAAACAGGGGGGGSTQDMQVAWTPTNVKLGELIFANENIPEFTGVTAVIYNQSNLVGNLVFVTPQATLASISFPNLLTDSGSISATQLTALTSFSAPLAFSCAGIELSHNSLLTSITLGVASTTLNLNISNNPITALLLSNLTSVGGNLSVFQNTSLVSISCPLLTTAGNLDFDGCSSLTTVSLPNWKPPINTDVDVDSCALTAASVNHILARCIANPAFAGPGSTVELNGGTNAAPTGQGIADKAALIIRGCTVTTN